MSFKIQYVCHILLASENLLLSPSLEYFFEGKPEWILYNNDVMYDLSLLEISAVLDSTC